MTFRRNLHDGRSSMPLSNPIHASVLIHRIPPTSLPIHCHRHRPSGRPHRKLSPHDDDDALSTKRRTTISIHRPIDRSPPKHRWAPPTPQTTTCRTMTNASTMSPRPTHVPSRFLISNDCPATNSNSITMMIRQNYRSLTKWPRTIWPPLHSPPLSLMSECNWRYDTDC